MLDRPWAEMSRTDKPITQLGLAGLLKPFGVRPKQVRFDAVTLKGYRLDWFDRAFRYIPDAELGENTRNTETTAENGQKSRNITDADVSAKTAENGQCFGVSPDSTLAATSIHTDPFESLKDASLRLGADDYPELPPELDRRRRVL